MGQGNALMFNELTAIKQTLRRLKRERIENSPDGESHEKDPEMLTPEPRIHNGINPDSEHSEGYSRQDYLQFQEEIKRQQELRDENNHTPPQDTVTVDGDGIPEITIGGNSGENEFVPELEDDTPPKHLEDMMWLHYSGQKMYKSLKTRNSHNVIKEIQAISRGIQGILS